MSTKVVLPPMGESILEGTVTKWLKKVGEKVSRDEPLFEVTTEKVDTEIPSPATGVLAEILVPEGKTVPVNSVVAVIEDESAQVKPSPDTSRLPAEEPSEAAKTEELPSKPPVEVVPTEMPPVPVEEEVQEAKAVSMPEAEPEAAAAPLPEALAPPPPIQEIQRPAPPTPAPIGGTPDIRTSPLVRRLAREYDIDLSTVKGTGLESRITRQDILNLVETRSQPTTEAGREVPPAAPAAKPEPISPAETRPAAVPEASRPPIQEPRVAPPPPIPAPTIEGQMETVPMTAMRKAIAEHMALSRRTAADVTTVFEIDVSGIAGVRDRHKDQFAIREGVPLTYTPFFVKALVDNVREYPIFNSSISGDNIVFKKPVNVGIAVALETGLIVPVIKDAHLKSFTALALAIHDLAERARTKRLKPDDVQNGTITVTNPGIIGSLFFTPIIHQPQVAILGVGAIRKRVVVINDAIAIRPVVYLSLSYDHRAVDGAVADQFMARLKDRLESWNQWLE